MNNNRSAALFDRLDQLFDISDIGPIINDGNGIDTFTQAADDSVQVLEYVHDNAIDQ